MLILEWATDGGWQGTWALIYRLLLKILFLLLHFTSPFLVVPSGSNFSRAMVTRLRELGTKMWEHTLSFYRLFNNLIINITHHCFSGAAVSTFWATQGFYKSNWLVSGQYHLCRHLDLTSLYSAKSFIISLSDFPPSIMWFGVTDVS